MYGNIAYDHDHGLLTGCAENNVWGVECQECAADRCIQCSPGLHLNDDGVCTCMFES